MIGKNKSIIHVAMYARREYIACMNQITIRKVSDRGVERAREMARERGVPLNDIYVEAIEEGLGVRGRKPANGLEVFSGDSDFGSEWENYLNRDLNRIDEEIWR